MRIDAYNAVSQIYKSSTKVNTAKKTSGSSEFSDKLKFQMRLKAIRQQSQQLMRQKMSGWIK